jgi:hypothetical protein
MVYYYILPNLYADCPTLMNPLSEMGCFHSRSPTIVMIHLVLANAVVNERYIQNHVTRGRHEFILRSFITNHVYGRPIYFMVQLYRMVRLIVNYVFTLVFKLGTLKRYETALTV